MRFLYKYFYRKLICILKLSALNNSLKEGGHWSWKWKQWLKELCPSQDTCPFDLSITYFSISVEK